MLAQLPQFKVLRSSLEIFYWLFWQLKQGWSEYSISCFPGGGEKADVVTTYPIDLVAARPIIAACT
jgi:hypothetical protein